MAIPKYSPKTISFNVVASFFVEGNSPNTFLVVNGVDLSLKNN